MHMDERDTRLKINYQVTQVWLVYEGFTAGKRDHKANIKKGKHTKVKLALN